MDGNDLLDLFSGSDGQAQSSAAALAQAIRQRRAAGTLGMITGDAAMTNVGREFAGQADKMETGLLGAAQHRAQQQSMAAWRNQLLGVRQQDADTRAAAVAQKPALVAAKTAAGGAHAGHGGPAAPFDPDAIAEAIIAGKISPVIAGMPREKGAVLSSLAKKGFDQAGAESDWHATQKHIATLNNSQQTRLRQTLDSMPHQLDTIDELYAQWQRVAPQSGFRVLNRAALGAAKQMGGDVGAIASSLEAQINDVSAELANVYMGGNSPTDHALKLAETNLKGEWDEPTFRKAMELTRRNVRIRRNSVLHSPVAGASEGNPYAGKPAEPAAPAPAKATHRFNPATGKIEAIP